MANRLSSGFRTRAQNHRVPDNLVRITIDSVNHQFSDGAFASTASGLFENKIVSWGGSVTHAANEHDGGLSSPTLSFSIADPGDALAAIFRGETSRTIVGSAVVAFVAYDDLAEADWFPFFGGLVSSRPSLVDRKVWLVECRYDDFALSADTSDLFVQSISTGLFPDLANADASAAGNDIPIVYGINVGGAGAVKCPYVSTIGDDEDTTNGHRYLVCAGYAQDIPTVYANDTSTTPVKDTDWFWTTRAGKSFTEVGFSTARTTDVIADVHGLTTNGLGSTTLGDLITNKAKQIEHLLTNFVFQLWEEGAFFTPGTDSPLNTASITTLETYLDGVGQVDPIGANVLTSQAALTLVNDWRNQNQIAVWWSEDGDLHFGVRDPFLEDSYLDDNTPANWPWFRAQRHGRGPATFDEDGNLQTDRVTFKGGWTPAAGFEKFATARSFERAITSGETIEGKWLGSDGTAGVEFDAPSRRLRRVQLPIATYETETSVAFLDPEMLDGFLVSDLDAPTSDGNGWGENNIYDPRLFSLVRRSYNPATRTVKITGEDETAYRATLWDTGTGETKAGTGVALFYRINGIQTVRATSAWVPNLGGQIEHIASGESKRTPSGLLIEGLGIQIVANASFLDGVSGWTQITPGQITLQTGVLLFTAATAIVSDLTVSVTSSSVANPSVITTAVHGLTSGQQVLIRNHSGSTPDINGTHVATVLTTTTFSIPVNVTVGGTGGRVGGVNQTVNMATTSGPLGSSLNRVTSSTAGASTVQTFSGWIKDNSSDSARLRIQNTTTTNWLVSGSTWQASAVDVTTGWTETAGLWVRQELTFTMESTTSTLDVHIISPVGVGNSDWAHAQVENRPFATSVITGRNSDGSVTRDADVVGWQNDTADRVIPFDTKGTFRCIYAPIQDEADQQGANPIILRVDDGSTTIRFTIEYGFGSPSGFRVSWDGTTFAQVDHDIVKGTEYKIVVRWIGSDLELNRIENAVIIDMFDPVAGTWQQADSTGGTQTADGTTRAWLGAEGPSATGIVAWAHMKNIECIPFVLTDDEARDYP